MSNSVEVMLEQFNEQKENSTHNFIYESERQHKREGPNLSLDKTDPKKNSHIMKTFKSSKAYQIKYN